MARHRPERRPGEHLQPRPERRRGRRRLRARRDPRHDRDLEQGLSIDDRPGEPGEARRADHDALVAALARQAFGKIDRDSADKGAEIFKRKLENNLSCWDCHGEIKREDPNRSFKMTLFATGTDAKAFVNFSGRSGPSGKLEGLPVNFIPLTEKIPANAPATLDDHQRGHRHHPGHLHVEPADRSAQGCPVRPPSRPPSDGGLKAMYEARPLNGIWATAPYPAQRVGPDARRPVPQASRPAQDLQRGRPHLRHREGGAGRSPVVVLAAQARHQPARQHQRRPRIRGRACRKTNASG